MMIKNPLAEDNSHLWLGRCGSAVARVLPVGRQRPRRERPRVAEDRPGLLDRHHRTVVRHLDRRVQRQLAVLSANRFPSPSGEGEAGEAMRVAG